MDGGKGEGDEGKSFHNSGSHLLWIIMIREKIEGNGGDNDDVGVMIGKRLLANHLTCQFPFLMDSFPPFYK